VAGDQGGMDERTGLGLGLGIGLGGGVVLVAGVVGCVFWRRGRRK
jgi:hypothetical protein